MTFHKAEYELENYLVSPVDYIISKKVKVVYRSLRRRDARVYVKAVSIFAMASGTTSFGHSINLAMRDIELFKLPKRENELYREILAFSIPTICQGHG